MYIERVHHQYPHESFFNGVPKKSNYKGNNTTVYRLGIISIFNQPNLSSHNYPKICCECRLKLKNKQNTSHTVSFVSVWYRKDKHKLTFFAYNRHIFSQKTFISLEYRLTAHYRVKEKGEPKVLPSYKTCIIQSD